MAGKRLYGFSRNVIDAIACGVSSRFDLFNGTHVWLVDNGYVTRGEDDRLELTDIGRAIAAEVKAKKLASKKRARASRRMRDAAYESCGLTKVRGAVSGRTYWE